MSLRLVTQLVVTYITTMFFFYPNVINNLLALFACRNVDFPTTTNLLAVRAALCSLHAAHALCTAALLWGAVPRAHPQPRTPTCASCPVFVFGSSHGTCDASKQAAAAVRCGRLVL